MLASVPLAAEAASMLACGMSDVEGSMLAVGASSLGCDASCLVEEESPDSVSPSSSLSSASSPSASSTNSLG